MRFQCGFCGSVMRDLNAKNLGAQVECPSCRHLQVLPSSPFGPGRIIGDFVVIQKVGEGSIGTVYLARQISLDRNLALKVLSIKYTNRKGIASFLAEARTAAKLNHPSIVQVCAVGEDNGICFMAMTFIQGKTVRQRIDEDGKIGVDEALHIVQQVSEGLHFAWTEENLIHRDIKPENIIITTEGAAKLTDLGLAISEDECTKGMEISGTPFYMSPEQFAGEKLDTRTDIYSLGVTLYQMLSGQLPYKGDTLNTVAKQHFYEKATPLKKLDSSIPSEVEKLVGRMMAKHPDDRFSNIEELLNDVWKIRQKTAPSKDMVPGVHTISIKKLDYKQPQPSPIPHKSFQSGKIPKTPFKAPAPEADEENVRINKTLIFSAMGAVLIIVLVFVFVFADRAKRLTNIETELLPIEKHFAQTNSVSLEIEDDCKKLLQRIGTPKTEADKAIMFRLKFLISEMQIRRLAQENLRLKDEMSALEKKTTVKSNNLTSSMKEDMLELAAEKDAEIAEIEQAFEKEKKQWQDEKEALNRKIADFGKKLEHEKKMADEKLRTVFFAKYYSAIRQCKFTEAAALLKEFSGKSEISPEDLARFNEQIARLAEFHTAFTASGNKYTKTATPDGIVIRIVDEEVDLNVSGSFSTKKWTQLSVESLAAIALKAFPDLPEKYVKSDICLLLGKPGDAISFSPDHKLLEMVVNSAFYTGLDSVKSLAETDKKKALPKFQILQKEFDGIPKFSEELQALKPSLEDSPPTLSSPLGISPPKDASK